MGLCRGRGSSEPDYVWVCAEEEEAVSQIVCGFVQGNRKQWKRVEFSGRWIRGVSAGGPLNSFTSSTYNNSNDNNKEDF